MSADTARPVPPPGPLGDRWVWLDGGPRPGWDTPVLAVCRAADPSLTWSAATGLVHRHVGVESTDGDVRWESEPIGDDPFDALAAELVDGREWFGWWGYASRRDLPARTHPAGASRPPDAVWLRPSLVLALPAPADPCTPAPPGPVPPVPADYRAGFEEVRERLLAGDSYEVNLTLRDWASGPGDVWGTAEALRRFNPAPFSGVVSHHVPGHTGALVSASPERYLRVVDGVAETRPIKGTSPRGRTPEEDAELARRLAVDPKTRAENLMVTDLLRHDVALVSEPGTVQVPELMVVESHPSVHQLVTSVRGRLRPEVSPLEAARALFPPGSMTGAPKLRTMEVIEAVETTPRGVYSGAFGRISRNSADLAVVIRSLTTPGPDSGTTTWEWGTGGGVTVDSTLTGEWEELCWKAERLRRALSPLGG